MADALLSALVSLADDNSCSQIQSAVDALMNDFFEAVESYVTRCKAEFQLLHDEGVSDYPGNLIAKRDKCCRATRRVYGTNFIKNLFTALNSTNLEGHDLDVFLAIFSGKNIQPLKCIQDG